MKRLQLVVGDSCRTTTTGLAVVVFVGWFLVVVTVIFISGPVVHGFSNTAVTAPYLAGIGTARDGIPGGALFQNPYFVGGGLAKISRTTGTGTASALGVSTIAPSQPSQQQQQQQQQTTLSSTTYTAGGAKFGYGYGRDDSILHNGNYEHGHFSTSNYLGHLQQQSSSSAAVATSIATATRRKTMVTGNPVLNRFVPRSRDLVRHVTTTTMNRHNNRNESDAQTTVHWKVLDTLNTINNKKQQGVDVAHNNNNANNNHGNDEIRNKENFKNDVVITVRNDEAAKTAAKKTKTSQEDSETIVGRNERKPTSMQPTASSSFSSRKTIDPQPKATSAPDVDAESTTDRMLVIPCPSSSSYGTATMAYSASPHSSYPRRSVRAASVPTTKTLSFTDELLRSVQTTTSPTARSWTSFASAAATKPAEEPKLVSADGSVLLYSTNVDHRHRTWNHRHTTDTFTTSLLSATSASSSAAFPLASSYSTTPVVPPIFQSHVNRMMLNVQLAYEDVVLHGKFAYIEMEDKIQRICDQATMLGENLVHSITTTPTETSTVEPSTKDTSIATDATTTSSVVAAVGRSESSASTATTATVAKPASAATTTANFVSDNNLLTATTASIDLPTASATATKLDMPPAAPVQQHESMLEIHSPSSAQAISVEIPNEFASATAVLTNPTTETTASSVSSSSTSTSSLSETQSTKSFSPSFPIIGILSKGIRFPHFAIEFPKSSAPSLLQHAVSSKLIDLQMIWEDVTLQSKYALIDVEERIHEIRDQAIVAHDNMVHSIHNAITAPANPMPLFVVPNIVTGQNIVVKEDNRIASAICYSMDWLKEKEEEFRNRKHNDNDNGSSNGGPGRKKRITFPWMTEVANSVQDSCNKLAEKMSGILGKKSRTSVLISSSSSSSLTESENLLVR